METLNDLSNNIGFGSFKGMILFFCFLIFWFLFGLAIYYGQKRN